MADLTTVQEVLDHFERNMSDEARRARAEVLALKEDIEAAQAAILDALERYRKKKLRARSRASANSADTFAALEGYGSREEIRDAYGWGLITERKMDRLTLNSLGPIYGVQRISGETNRQYKRRILRAAHVIDTVQLRWPVRPVEPKEQGHE